MDIVDSISNLLGLGRKMKIGSARKRKGGALSKNDEDMSEEMPVGGRRRRLSSKRSRSRSRSVKRRGAGMSAGGMSAGRRKASRSRSRSVKRRGSGMSAGGMSAGRSRSRSVKRRSMSAGGMSAGGMSAGRRKRVSSKRMSRKSRSDIKNSPWLKLVKAVLKDPKFKKLVKDGHFDAGVRGAIQFIKKYKMYDKIKARRN